MNSWHNLGTVLSFEFWRTIKKPSFWAATLSFPLIFIAIFGIIWYSGKTADDSSEKLTQEKFSMQYVDESGLIQGDIAHKLGAEPITDKAEGISRVRSGDVDAFFYYPRDVIKDKVEVYGKDAGLFDNQKYSSVAEQLIKTSAVVVIDDPQVFAVASDAVSSTTTAYQDDGAVAPGWSAAIPPLVLLGFLYLIVGMLGNNLLNSTVEEKENRVTEMILTTLNPTVLIVGKLLATFLAGLAQAAVIIIPLVIAYLVLGAESLNLPNMEILSTLVFEPQALIVGTLLLIGGLMLFTGTLVAIGAIMPTAKEAGQYFSLAIVVMFAPFYIIMSILSNPDSIVSQVFTYFPFTSPVTAMLRNAFGSLSLASAAIVIATLLVLGVCIILLAVRLFRYGAMQYDSKLSLSFLKKKES